MIMRKGLGKNLGKGYKNLIHIDSYIHSLSAKGVKTYQKLLIINNEPIFTRKTKKGYKVYFDNKRLMTENTFGSKQEAKEWIEDLRSIGGLEAKGKKVQDYHKDKDYLMEWDTYEILIAEAEYRINNVSEFDWLLDESLSVETDKGIFESWREIYESVGQDDKKFVKKLKELDLFDTFEEMIQQKVWEDQDIYTFAWDDLMGYLQEKMDVVSKTYSKPYYWKARVENFGWRSLEGEKDFYADTSEEFLRNILPDTDCTFRIFKMNNGFKIQNFHHDSPTGREWYYIKPMTAKEVEEKM